MKSSCHHSNDRDAFTLTELLVATAVLALILVLMLQVVDHIMQSTRLQNRQMDAVASARRALDVLEADLRTVVISPDTSLLAGLGSETRISFLSRRRGPENASDHRFLALAYATNSRGQIVRSYESIPHGATNFFKIPVPSDSNSSQVADGVLAWQIRAVTDHGKPVISSAAVNNWASNEYNTLAVPPGYQALIASGPAFASRSTNRTHAVEVWIAATDPTSYQRLADLNSLTNIQVAILAAAPEDWQKTIDAMEIPAGAKSAVRVLQKTIPLP